MVGWFKDRTINRVGGIVCVGGGGVFTVDNNIGEWWIRQTLLMESGIM